MQFLEFLSLLHKRGLSYASLKNSFPFSENVDYHMQVSRIPCPSPKTWTIVLKFQEFLYLLKERGLSHLIYGISFSSPKTWIIICNFLNFFLFSKIMDYHMQ